MLTSYLETKAIGPPEFRRQISR